MTLIDTPGLDDTQRFRVQLTERAVQDVDAVLFLTKSGASYGQSEKDFVLSLLRKGSIKQLIFVVTHVDQTYEQHVREAHNQDEDPDAIDVRISLERKRLQREIDATLSELADESGSVAIDRYRDQLNSVEIAFTSAANHIDARRGESVRYPLRPNDPGSIHYITTTLYKILSTESRLAAIKHALQSGIAAILQDMLAVIDARRSVVASLKSKEVAENKLSTFRREFEQSGKQFAEVTKRDGEVLQGGLSSRAEVQALIAENIAHRADQILASYEIDDAARHWRTRRGGRWGYMVELQTRVANRIFPAVAEELGKLNDAFGEFVAKLRAHIEALSDEAEAIISHLEIGEELELNLGASLEAFLNDTLQGLQELIEGEELRIVSLLEDFVDQQVEDRIIEARDKVTAVWGRGTTINQTNEVRAFYSEVRNILREALKTHVLRRFDDFGRHLTAQANLIPGKTLSEVAAQIDRTGVNIRAAAEAMVTGQKGDFERISAALASAIRSASVEVSALLDDDSEGEAVQPPSVKPIEPDTPVKAIEPPNPVLSALDDIRERATTCICRYTLKNNAKGWPWGRIFSPEFFKGSTEAWLIDPYLAKRFQKRNLSEFVMAVLDNGANIKTLNLITRGSYEGAPDDERTYYDALDRDTFEKSGMRVICTVDPQVHDRFFVMDNGYVFKLGRGLDIYKPAIGLAARDAGLRQVRACEIDVFGPPEDGYRDQQ